MLYRNFFRFALGYDIRSFQANDGDLKLNDTHHLSVYVDDANILGGRVHNVKKNGGAFLVCSKDNGLEVAADKTEYMVMSRDQNAELSHNVKTDNNSFF